MDKRKITLVEVLIAGTIASIAIVMMLTVVMNLHSVFRAGTIDYKMTEYGHLVKQKVVRSYGLRQAFWKSIGVEHGEISFNAVASDTEWPETDVINTATILKFDPTTKEVAVNSDLKDDKELEMMGIKVRKIAFVKQERDTTNSLSVNKVIIHVLFEKIEGGVPYVREERINITSQF